MPTPITWNPLQQAVDRLFDTGSPQSIMVVDVDPKRGTLRVMLVVLTLQGVDVFVLNPEHVISAATAIKMFQERGYKPEAEEIINDTTRELIERAWEIIKTKSRERERLHIQA